MTLLGSIGPAAIDSSNDMAQPGQGLHLGAPCDGTTGALFPEYGGFHTPFLRAAMKLSGLANHMDDKWTGHTNELQQNQG